MSWASAVKTKAAPKALAKAVEFNLAEIDWDRLVTLDFETYYDQDYTLKKLSTSEYIRDPRFKAQMVGIKIGRSSTKIYSAKKLKSALKAINWATHSLLAHHAQFDGFILSHHYKIFPKRIYCTLSMARGLHSNEIGAGLDEVSVFYGGKGKIAGGLQPTMGVLDWPPALVKTTSVYCRNDVDECFRIFMLMQPKMPSDEIDLIDVTCRMFTDPVLRLNIPRVETELKRELAARDEALLAVLPLIDKTDPDLKKGWTKAERELTGRAADLMLVKKQCGSNLKFADLLRTQKIDPPVKISPAWIKNGRPNDNTKWSFAFAKDDQDFIMLPEAPEKWSSDIDRNKKKSVIELAVRAAVIRTLIDARLAVKSTTNITRAQRFLTAGANGMPLPAYYAYARAHTLRWGGGDKRNMQNLTRGGELRLSIEAPAGHHLVVVDSGQIEARTNGWLWDQNDLLAAFAAADAGTGRDAYCLMASSIYGRVITKADTIERFVGKVVVLGLGFQMGAAKLQLTLAKGALGGPPVYFTLQECENIVHKYRRLNSNIVRGWDICKGIIEDMAAGRSGSYKCLSWGAETIWLPNGLTLKYPNLRRATNEHGYEEWSYEAGDQRKKIYGGLLCENIVQALARIIVGVQMLAISRKYRLVMTTHDEAVACVKAAIAQMALDFMLKCFRTPPKWCADIPLNAEGGHAENYSK